MASSACSKRWQLRVFEAKLPARPAPPSVHQEKITPMTLKALNCCCPLARLTRCAQRNDFGADAVYAGQPRYSLRARNNEFRLEQILKALKKRARARQEVFVTSNLIAQ